MIFRQASVVLLVLMAQAAMAGRRADPAALPFLGLRARLVGPLPGGSVPGNPAAAARPGSPAAKHVQSPARAEYSLAAASPSLRSSCSPSAPASPAR